MAPSQPLSPTEWAQNVIAKRDRDLKKLCARHNKSPELAQQGLAAGMSTVRSILRKMKLPDSIDGDTATVDRIKEEMRAMCPLSTGNETDAELAMNLDEAIIVPLAEIHTLAQRIIGAPPVEKAGQPVKAEPLPAVSAKKTPPLHATATAKKPAQSAAKTTAKATPAHQTPAAPANLGDSGVLEFMPVDPPQENGEPATADEPDWAEMGIEPTAPVHKPQPRRKGQPKP